MNLKIYLTILLTVLATQLSYTQDLPKLKTSTAVTVGTLPNGVKYNLVTSRTATGLADFALVQKGFSNPEVSRKAMEDLPHFRERKAWDFLARNGVGYNPEGFVKYTSESTVFHFRDVPSTVQSVSDSTLLLLFDLALSSPYEETIVVAGDITPAKIKERMEMLSMLLPHRIANRASEPYLWCPSERKVEYTISRPGDAARISITFRAPRTPEKFMGTAQPLVSELFIMELSEVIKARVDHEFRNTRIPLVEVSCDYTGSGDGPGDVCFTTNVATTAEMLERAVSATAGILSDIDLGGVSPQEFKEAKARAIIKEGWNAANSRPSNSEWIGKCVAATLYGADLADESTHSAFFAGKRLEESVEYKFFNDFVSAMLDSKENLTIELSGPSRELKAEDLEKMFETAWFASQYTGPQAAADTLGLATATKKKLKLKSSVAEPLTGGQLWTLSNGMKVIFRKDATKGYFRYALMVKGGFGQVSGVTSDESVFIGDILPLADVAGIDSRAFGNMLTVNGIEMGAEVSQADMRITGKAPSDRLQLVLKSLLSVANDRQANKDAYDAYRASEAGRIAAANYSEEGLVSYLDSLLREDGSYSNRKMVSGMHDDLQKRAEVYFARQFSNMGNSLLVFYGDLNEAELKKQLCRYLGGFSCGTQRPLRSQAKFGSKDVWYTIGALEGQAPVGDGLAGVTVEMSSPMQFGTGTTSTLGVAATALRRALAKECAAIGCTFEVKEKTEFFPAERVAITVVCHACEADGLPASISPAEPGYMLAAVRRAVNTLAKGGISEAELKTCREVLTARTSDSLNDADMMVGAVLTRNSEGKDLISGYKEKISAVKAADVTALVKKMAASKAEYIVY